MTDMDEAELDRLEGLTDEESRLKIAEDIAFRVVTERNALEQRIKALEEALGALGDGADMVAKKAFIVQPFLAIWKKHGTLIEECRARSTQEKHDAQDRR